MNFTLPTDIARLPTKWGNFKVFTVATDHPEMPHVVMVSDIFKHSNALPLVRIHSECFTGDVLGSLRCDCQEQLHTALGRVAAEGGVLLYLRQEGRGSGLTEKIKAYVLQEQGYDTVESQVKLHLPVDDRDYKDAAKILKSLNVSSIRLLTNNPAKIQDLERQGIKIVERIPIVMPANEHNRAYLTTKQNKMGHLFTS